MKSDKVKDKNKQQRKSFKKIAVIFPGIGYHTDKPLLYYGKKLAAGLGYEIQEVPYKGFKSGIKGDAARMKEAFELALAQTEEMLAQIQWDQAEDILFISKSIGTVVAAAYADRHGLTGVRHIYFTPLKETFLYPAGDSAIVFHGTADPWAEDQDIEEGCSRLGLPLILVPDSNHSLETGNVLRDLHNLQEVMVKVDSWIRG